MAKRKQFDLTLKVGSWAFIIGFLIAVVAGFMSRSAPWVTWTLVILGLVVGLLNITAKETTPFLIASVSLVIVAYLGGASSAIKEVTYLSGVLSSILIFVIPATIIVALKTIYVLARTR